MKNNTTEMVLLMDGNRGIQMGRSFAIKFTSENMSDGDRATLLAGPDHAEYVDTWFRVVGYCTVKMLDRSDWTLYIGGSGDLFAVPPGFDWGSFEDC